MSKNNQEFLKLKSAPEIQAAKDEKKNPTFSMVAYTGKQMNLWGFYHPVVIELSGIEIPSQKRPILLNHTNDPAYIMGQTSSIKVVDGKLIASGEIMGVSDKAKEVIELAGKGFEFQASVGASVLSREFVEAGQKAQANGQEFSGPINIVRQSRLGEISFVALGADDDTSAQIAAGQYFDFQENKMDKDKKVEAAATEVKPDVQAAPKAEVKAEVTPDIVAQANDAYAANLERIARIQAACKDSPEIAAKAIKDNWTPEKAELEVLRAARPKVAGIIVDNDSTSASMLECAAMLSGGISADDLVKDFDEKTVSAASKHFKRGIGLQQLIMEAARLNGYSRPYFKGYEREALQAAFSTLSLPGIFANTANKFLLKGFMGVEQVWRRISSVRSVNDFKAITSYRLNGAFTYDEVGPDGELKHGTVSEDSYTNQAKTYGKMFGITRQDIINDDMGALSALPQRIGRGAGLKLNEVFWAAFLSNSSFFTTARKNYASGTATALGYDSLAAALVLFLNQTDPDNKPLGASPKLLLVPPALLVAAKQLYASTELRDTTASTKTPVANIFAGTYEPIVSTYLSNSTLTGYSAKAWYLLADPNDLAVMEVAFLNGKQEPTVESADADFNTLGIQMRGYHDFGVAQQEYRGGVKMKGEN